MYQGLGTLVRTIVLSQTRIKMSSVEDEDEDLIVLEDSLQFLPSSVSEVDSASASTSAVQAPPLAQPTSASSSSSNAKKPFVPHTHSSGCAVGYLAPGHALQDAGRRSFIFAQCCDHALQLGS